jgi:hypothetical protein
MKRYALWLALPALAIALPASAAKKDATKITCAEFAAQSPEGQARITAFLDGYSKRGKKVEDVASVDVQRQLDVLVVSCQQDPKATLWEKLKAHMPGGKLKVAPVKMTCEDFLALGSSVQPEVAYWLDGYNRKENVMDAGQVDLERDTAVLVQACKPAPKESLWKKIKDKL